MSVFSTTSLTPHTLMRLPFLHRELVSKQLSRWRIPKAARSSLRQMWRRGVLTSLR